MRIHSPVDFFPPLALGLLWVFLTGGFLSGAFLPQVALAEEGASAALSAESSRRAGSTALERLAPETVFPKWPAGSPGQSGADYERGRDPSVDDKLQRRDFEPIGQVRSDADGDGVPDRVGDTVSVTGRITAEPGAIPVPDRGIGALQGPTGGIHIALPADTISENASAGNSPDTTSPAGSVSLEGMHRPVLSRGDSAKVWGVLRHEAGLAQIEVVGYKEVGTPTSRVPDPIPLSVPTANGERYEGRLARVEGVVTANSENRGGRYFVLREQRDSEAQLTVFVSRRRADQIPLARFEVGNEVAVTGIISQYDLSYQILPREPQDLARIDQAQTYLQWALYGIGGLGLTSLIAVFLLRAAVRRRTQELERQAERLKQSQEELREKESRLRSITENAADGIYRSAPGEGLIYANQAFAEMFGYEGPEDVLDVPPATLYADPSERDRLQRQCEDEGGFDATEVTFQRKDGSTFTGLLSGTVVRDEEGEIQYYDGAITDITDRKRREHKLRLYSEIVKQAEDAILVTEANEDGTDGEVIYANEAFERMSGYSREEIVGQTPRILQGPETDPEVIDSLREAICSGRPWEGETINYRKGGEPYVVRWTVAPVRGKGGSVQYWASVQRDVTQERKRERMLREAKEKAEEARREAEEASRLKSAFLANMSHEIRTPLTSVIGFAEAIGEDASEARRFAPLIEKSGKRLLKTLDGVLNLSKLEAGQMTLSPEPVDLASQARLIAEEHQRQAEEAGVDLSVEAPGSGAYAVADEGGVQIVVRNLVSNAIKYAEGGTAVVRVYETDEEAVLEVEDDGIGMDPEVAESLFEPFRQAVEGIGREYEGTGVGLAVTSRAVREMNGQIDVETEKGEGSRFTIRLPRAEKASTAAPEGKKSR